MLIIGTLLYTITLSASCTFIGLSGICQNDTQLDGTDESIPELTTDNITNTNTNTNTTETRRGYYRTDWVQT